MCLKAAIVALAAFSFFPRATVAGRPRNRNVDEQADLLEDRGHR